MKLFAKPYRKFWIIGLILLIGAGITIYKVRDKKTKQKIAEAKKEFDFEVSAFTLGNTLIIGLPAEPFVEIGLEIRKEIFADASQVLCSIMNNGSGSGYIPNLWNYRRGGYENTPRSNPFSIHTASVLKDICRDIKELLKK